MTSTGFLELALHKRKVNESHILPRQNCVACPLFTYKIVSRWMHHTLPPWGGRLLDIPTRPCHPLYYSRSTIMDLSLATDFVSFPAVGAQEHSNDRSFLPFDPRTIPRACIGAFETFCIGVQDHSFERLNMNRPVHTLFRQCLRDVNQG